MKIEAWKSPPNTETKVALSTFPGRFLTRIQKWLPNRRPKPGNGLRGPHLPQSQNPSRLHPPLSDDSYALVLLTFFMVVSCIAYGVIVEPPGIGSTQDPSAGSVRPVVFLPGRVNEQYIIEGLSSGFMFVLGGIGIVLMGLALDKNRAKSVEVSYAMAGASSVIIAYVMSMLFVGIKIHARSLRK